MSVLRPFVAISTVGLGLAVVHFALKWRLSAQKLRDDLKKATDELEKERAKRKSERKGRINAEQELRALAVQLPAQQQPTQQLPSVFPFKAIGRIHSCFNQRNGTPRQPLLVPAARCSLKLAPDVPRSCLEGLQGFSHCWVLYVFHCNTDLAKSLGPNRSAVKGKVNVPRLDGGRCGVLATRSPHRPCPIGLSTARILGVEGDRLLLGGADIVDGSPVLDIKPYLPFCDSLPSATAPPWVKEEADDEPLRVVGVAIPEAARQLLHSCWEAKQAASLYADADAFVELVQQVLARDIRSVHQRRLQPATAGSASFQGDSGPHGQLGASNGSSSSSGGGGGGGSSSSGVGSGAAPTSTGAATTQDSASAGSADSDSNAAAAGRGQPRCELASGAQGAASLEEEQVSQRPQAGNGAGGGQPAPAALPHSRSPGTALACAAAPLLGVPPPGTAVGTAALDQNPSAARSVPTGLTRDVRTAAGAGGVMGGADEVLYHVVLDGVDVQYKVRGVNGVVEVLSAAVA